MSGRGRRGDDRDRGGGRRGDRGGRDYDRDRGGRGRERRGGGRRGDRDPDGERGPGTGASPTKDVQFKIQKNVERERERQLEMEFPGERGLGKEISFKCKVIAF